MYWDLKEHLVHNNAFHEVQGSYEQFFLEVLKGQRGPMAAFWGTYGESHLQTRSRSSTRAVKEEKQKISYSVFYPMDRRKDKNFKKSVTKTFLDSFERF